MKKRKKVTVRVPVPSKEYLKKHSTEFPISGFKTPQDLLRFYIRCRNEEIIKQKLEIEKCKKRIEKNIECIKNAQDAIEELDKEEKKIIEDSLK